MRGWMAAKIPDQSGRTAVVTGANSGLGYEVALGLARAGAHVVLACRDLTRGQDALERVRAQAPGASAELVRLDLASLVSVREAAEQIAAAHEVLDLLVNNAGVMALPLRHTAEGFEMQFGTNHLGHFALTGHLLPRLLARAGSRVVTVSSVGAHAGSWRLDDLKAERGYRAWPAYFGSKLANLSFAFELQRRLVAAGLGGTGGLLSVAAHPGYASTHLQTVAPAMTGKRLTAATWTVMNRALAQSARAGAQPLLHAAVAPGVRGGAFYGPVLAELYGRPHRSFAPPRAYDATAAALLWTVSEAATGVRYEALDVAA
ncbi:MAG: oxidoreductase [Sporichthyaceae bacterium]